jgi:hypothetical protein
LGVVDPDTVVICWVGRFVTEKRPDIFAYCIRELYARGLNYHAVVIGAGPCQSEFASLPRTTCLGWMTPEELKIAYASCDVFLFPSAVETFGNVTLEAAASGLPVVVERNCSGHLVNDGVSGFACDAEDPNAFLQATIALIQNKQLRQSFSAASHVHAMKFDQHAVCRQMLDNYAQVTDEFYAKYGGCHLNRDEARSKQQGSFRCGNHPFPFGLVIVLWFAVLVVRVANRMENGWIWVRSHLERYHGSQYSDASLPSSKEGKQVVIETSVSRNVPSPVGKEWSVCVGISACISVIARALLCCLRFQSRTESRIRNAACNGKRKGISLVDDEEYGMTNHSYPVVAMDKVV